MLVVFYFFAFYSRLASFLSSLNLSSLAEEGDLPQGKPEGFCLPCKGRWVAAGKPEGFCLPCKGRWVAAGKPEGFCLPCKGRWVAAGKPEGFCLPCKGRWASSRQAGGILRSYMEFK